MTLTEVSYYSRKFAPFALLFFLIFLIFYYLVRIIFLTVSPPQQRGLYVDPIFGKIKKPVIENATTSAGLSFTIDTIEGRPTTATESAVVYFLPQAAARFGYRERIYLIAKTLGFDTEISKHTLTGKEAEFKDDRQQLKIDITNLNFTYEYGFENDPQIFASASIPDKSLIDNAAREFLQKIGRYPEELAQGKNNTIYIAYDPSLKQMKVQNSPVGANLVEIDFYRPDLEGLPAVSPAYFNSQNYLLLVYNQYEFKVLKAQIKYFEKSDAQIGTYPLKSGDSAYEDLKNGKGWLIQNATDQKKIVIKKMFLAYFDPDIYQEYLQPVYVFLGNGNFVSYVPAVTEEYFNQE